MSHDSNIVIADRTFIHAGFTAPCNGTVVAWEFCYQSIGSYVTFYPGIWRTNDNRDYALVQSNSITYDTAIQTDNVDSCQRVTMDLVGRVRRHMIIEMSMEMSFEE